MALEHREGRPYYYRYVRDGERVLKKYVAAGRTAEIVAEADAFLRADRKGAAVWQRNEMERWRDLAAPVLELVEAAEILARAHLIADGYHTHKGEWRRARRS